jgi:hypothetical protein
MKKSFESRDYDSVISQFLKEKRFDDEELSPCLNNLLKLLWSATKKKLLQLKSYE